MATNWKRVLQKIDDQRWLLPQDYKQGMRVPGLIFASEEMLHIIGQDEAIEQVANVAFLPGIVKYSMAMPDIHWGYGFPIGGVAAMRVDDGVVSPGGVGFVEATAFSADGRYLYYASNAGDIDRRDLWRVPVAGGQAQQLTRGDGIEHYPAVLASGDQVAILYADARRPLSVGMVPAAGGEARVITALPNEYPLDELVVLPVEPSTPHDASLLTYLAATAPVIVDSPRLLEEPVTDGQPTLAALIDEFGEENVITYE